MANYVFGSGTFVIDGVTVGTMQEFSLDIDGDVIELYGSNDFAVDVASGKKKVSCKFKAGEIQNTALAKLIGGTVASNGSLPVSAAAMGAVSDFEVSWTVTYQSQTYTITLLHCVFKKWSVSGGNDKHAIVDGEIACFHGSGGVATIAVAAAG